MFILLYWTVKKWPSHSHHWGGSVEIRLSHQGTGRHHHTTGLERDTLPCHRQTHCLLRTLQHTPASLWKYCYSVDISSDMRANQRFDQDYHWKKCFDTYCSFSHPHTADSAAVHHTLGSPQCTGPRRSADTPRLHTHTHTTVPIHASHISQCGKQVLERTWNSPRMVLY